MTLNKIKQSNNTNSMLIIRMLKIVNIPAVLACRSQLTVKTKTPTRLRRVPQHPTHVSGACFAFRLNLIPKPGRSIFRGAALNPSGPCY